MGANGYTKAICPSCKVEVDSDLPEHYNGDRRIFCFRPECGQITRLTSNGDLIIAWKRNVSRKEERLEETTSRLDKES